MTDEQFDEKICEAFAQVELSKEAEDRILANLLAAESQKSAEGTGDSTGKRRKRGRVVRWVAPAAIAAVLLVGVFVVRGIMPSFAPSGTVRLDENSITAEETAYDAGSAEVELVAMKDTDDSLDEAVPESAVRATGAQEVVVREDGMRFAIGDAYEVPEELDLGELEWQPATIESTGDSCEMATLEDGTVLVLFEDSDVLFRAELLA